MFWLFVCCIRLACLSGHPICVPRDNLRYSLRAQLLCIAAQSRVGGQKSVQPFFRRDVQFENPQIRIAFNA